MQTVGAAPPPLHLFVYGTLKQGECNHCRFCGRVREVAAGEVWGRLYHLPAGYPALVVAPQLILAKGGTDPLLDAACQQRQRNLVFNRPRGDWELVQGEVLTFVDPRADLPPIDRLEDFQPGGESMYRRVLLAVRCAGEIRAAWLYCMAPPIIGRRIMGGLWTASSRDHVSS